MKRKLQVRALKSGTVIDHLDSGTAIRALRLLGLPRETTVLVGANLPSGKHGKKDILKVDGRELTQDEINMIALISPMATFSIIRDYEVIRKIVPELPDQIEGLLRCVNPACVSQDSRVEGRFQTESRDPIRLRCYYCECSVSESEIDFL